jgi:hypothetical protein
VCDELRKLLGARQPSRGLVPAYRTGILASILPDVTHFDFDRIDRAPVEVRLAVMLAPLGDARRTQDILRALKFSNQEAELAGALVGVDAIELDNLEPKTVRQVLARLGKDKRAAAIELWETARPDLAAVARRVVNDPLDVSSLAVDGKELMTALQMKPGPQLGRILAALLTRVIEDPTVNTREKLLVEAQKLELELGL